MIDKSNYNNIDIPEELDAVVQKAIAEAQNSPKKTAVARILKKSVSIAAAFMICFVAVLNTSKAFAQTAYGIPVIGDLCRIFTLREYHFKDDIKYIDAKIPQIENTGKSDLEKKVNLEIQKKINDCINDL